MTAKSLKNILWMGCFYLTLIGGIGGCVAGMNLHNDSFGAISVISFLPMICAALWQWIDGRKFGNQHKLILRILLIGFAITILVITLSDPSLGIKVAAFGAIGSITIGPLIYAVVQSIIESRTNKDRLSIIGIVGAIILALYFLLSGRFSDEITAVFKVIAVLVTIYLYVSTIIVAYASFNGRDLKYKPLFGIEWLNSYFFAVGAFFGIAILLYFGLEKALFFIPEDWGWMDGEDETWTEARSYFAMLLAGCVSGFFIYALDLFRQERNKEKQAKKKNYL